MNLRIGTLMLAVSACAHTSEGGSGPSAKLTLSPKSGSTTSGEAEFTRVGNEVRLVLTVRGATPGLHAVHLHEKPDCSADDASSAGDHWNPAASQHGELGHPPYHLGDIGNLQVTPEGTGTLSLSTSLWTIGDGARTDVLDRSLVVHASSDDLTSAPAGNSGGRIACGVIAKTR
ncbi:MAG: superoxide dismutase family protein [Archangium sp.]|nr:superoxide dismutase family protein [Archangium sp.]